MAKGDSIPFRSRPLDRPVCSLSRPAGFGRASQAVSPSVRFADAQTDLT